MRSFPTTMALNVRSIQVTIGRGQDKIYLNLDATVTGAANGKADNGRAHLALECAPGRWPLVVEALGGVAGGRTDRPV